MNTIVFNKLSGQVLFEESAKEHERNSSRPYGPVLEVTPRPEVLLPDRPPNKDNLTVRHKKTG